MMYNSANNHQRARFPLQASPARIKPSTLIHASQINKLLNMYTVCLSCPAQQWKMRFIFRINI